MGKYLLERTERLKLRRKEKKRIWLIEENNNLKYNNSYIAIFTAR